MNRFKQSEIVGTVIILTLIFIVSFFNFEMALRRARDSQRRNDLSAVSNALHQFYEDFGYFPPAEDGQIKMCEAENFEENLVEIQKADEFDRALFFEGLRPCSWGEDGLDDLIDDEYGPYIERIPQDPRSQNGISYLYISNTKRFQLFAYMEGGSEEDGYNEGIVNRNLSCGKEICSFGRTYAETPLDISLDEYEAILEKQRLEKLQ